MAFRHFTPEQLSQLTATLTDIALLDSRGHFRKEIKKKVHNREKKKPTWEKTPMFYKAHVLNLRGYTICILTIFDMVFLREQSHDRPKIQLFTF